MTDSKYSPSTSTVASVGLGVPLATLIAWGLEQFAAISMPGEVQAALGALVSAMIGYAFLGGRRVDTQ